MPALKVPLTADEKAKLQTARIRLTEVADFNADLLSALLHVPLERFVP